MKLCPWNIKKPWLFNGWLYLHWASWGKITCYYIYYSGIKESLQNNPRITHEQQKMNTAVWFPLFIRKVSTEQHQSSSAQKRYVIFVSLHMHSSLSFATVSFSYFFPMSKRLEAVRACVVITTWGGEWHLESDRWKGIKFSLEPTVWKWYRFLPVSLSPSQSTTLTYLNRRSKLWFRHQTYFKVQNKKKKQNDIVS